MNPAWVSAAVSLTVLSGAIFLWGCRWAWRILRRTQQFLDDWYGEPPTPGHPGHAGAMERLTGVEQTAGKILHEVTLNSGVSVKDVVNQTQTVVTSLQSSVTDLQARVTSIARQVENLPGGSS